MRNCYAVLLLTVLCWSQPVFPQSKPQDNNAKLTAFARTAVSELLNEQELLQASGPRAPSRSYDRFDDLTVSKLPLCLIAGNDPLQSAAGAGVASAILGIRIPPSVDAVYATWSTQNDGTVALPKAGPSQLFNFVIISLRPTSRFGGEESLILIVDGQRSRFASMKKLDQRTDSGTVIETLGLAIPFRDLVTIAQARNVDGKVGPLEFSLKAAYLAVFRDYLRGLGAPAGPDIGFIARPATSVGFAKWSSAMAIEAFKAAGLEAVGAYAVTKDDFKDSPVPPTMREGIHFLIPSICPDCGGRVFSFESQSDLEQVQQYYVKLGTPGSLFGSWLFVKDNILLQINGRLPEEKAHQYERALSNIH